MSDSTIYLIGFYLIVATLVGSFLWYISDASLYLVGFYAVATLVVGGLLWYVSKHR